MDACCTPPDGMQLLNLFLVKKKFMILRYMVRENINA